MGRDDDRPTNVMPGGREEQRSSYRPGRGDLSRLVEILVGSGEPVDDRVAAARAIEQLVSEMSRDEAAALQTSLCAARDARPPHAVWTAIQRLLNRLGALEQTGRDVGAAFVRQLDPLELDVLAERLSDRLASRYEIGREISTGGMGRVFAARRLSDGRAAVAKYLLQAYAGRPDLEARFRREAEVLERLDHPNVVTFLEHGGDDGNLFLVMEYIEGGSLDRLVGKAELDAVRSGRILAGVADGLGAVHAAGVVHRDLKPANVLLADGDVPKLTDFGLALVQEDQAPRLTRPFEEFGTGPYMAPEQKRSSGDVDHAADLWSLGVMTYELFSGGSFPEIDYRPLAGMERGVPPGVDELVRRCLKVEPPERWPTAGAYREALDGAMENR